MDIFNCFKPKVSAKSAIRNAPLANIECSESPKGPRTNDRYEPENYANDIITLLNTRRDLKSAVGNSAIIEAIYEIHLSSSVKDEVAAMVLSKLNDKDDILFFQRAIKK